MLIIEGRHFVEKSTIQQELFLQNDSLTLYIDNCHKKDSHRLEKPLISCFKNTNCTVVIHGVMNTVNELYNFLDAKMVVARF